MKLKGNYKPRITPPLERGAGKITSPDEVTDTFADHYANILRDPIRKVNQRKTERKKKSYHIINH